MNATNINRCSAHYTIDLFCEVRVCIVSTTKYLVKYCNKYFETRSLLIQMFVKSHRRRINLAQFSIPALPPSNREISGRFLGLTRLISSSTKCRGQMLQILRWYVLWAELCLLQNLYTSMYEYCFLQWLCHKYKYKISVLVYRGILCEFGQYEFIPLMEITSRYPGQRLQARKAVITKPLPCGTATLRDPGPL